MTATGSDGQAARAFSGTVTFLFTDIEGSTRLLQRLGRERYREALAEHGRLLRESFEERSGEVIDTQGDSFFVAFRSAADAVAAAASAQRALQAHPWPNGGSLSVRMGMHTGEASLADDRYLGLSVHHAARVGSAAHGGQVLLSELTRGLVQDELPPGVGLRDLGEQHLKDIDRPVHLYQLELEGLPSEFPPLRTGESALAGREAELAAEAGAALRRRSRSRLGLVAGVVVAVAAAAAALLLARGGSGVAVAANSVAVIDPTTNKVVGDVTGVGTNPGRIVYGEHAVWVISSSDGTVKRIDPTTLRVVKTLAASLQATNEQGLCPSDLAVGAGKVWVACGTTGTVVPIDPNNNKPGIPIQLPHLTAAPSADGVTVGGGGVWVYDGSQSELFRIDPGRVVARARPFARVGNPSPTPVVVQSHTLWYLCCRSGGLQNSFTWVEGVNLRNRSPTGETAIGTGNPTALAGGAAALWVAARPDSLVRINPSFGGIESKSPLGRRSEPTALDVGVGEVWVANSGNSTVTRVDTGSNAVGKSIPIGPHAPAGVATGGGRVWVSVGAS